MTPGLSRLIGRNVIRRSALPYPFSLNTDARTVHLTAILEPFRPSLNNCPKVLFAIREQLRVFGRPRLHGRLGRLLVWCRARTLASNLLFYEQPNKDVVQRTFLYRSESVFDSVRNFLEHSRCTISIKTFHSRRG
jgi:hypothetical protein